MARLGSYGDRELKECGVTGIGSFSDGMGSYRSGSYRNGELEGWGGTGMGSCGELMGSYRYGDAAVGDFFITPWKL